MSTYQITKEDHNAFLPEGESRNLSLLRKCGIPHSYEHKAKNWSRIKSYNVAMNK